MFEIGDVSCYESEGAVWVQFARAAGDLTDVNAGTLLVSSVSYGVAGEVTSFVSGGGTESRSYNVNGQLTTLSLPGRTIAYNYPAAGLNNGKIESMTESGETVVYAYDSLQRLSSATGSGWGQTYGYDVFGNMNAKIGSGSAPSWSGSANAATNRLAGVSYDANGNQTNVPLVAGSEMPDALSSMIYDVSNRLIRAENNGATRRSDYEYDPGNKRVYEKRSVNGSAVGEWAYFFGITGQRLGRYSFTVSGASIVFSQAQASVWFGGKLVQKFEGAAVTWASEDRLGSVGKYLPYGEGKPGAAGSNPAADNEKFATYTRDSGTGLDYADQRWHVAGSGRFLTSDPYQASGGAADPGSWNRFGYVGGDPSNYIDASGLLRSNCSDVKLCLPAGDGSESASPGGGGSASGCSLMLVGNSFVPNLANCYVPPGPPEPPERADDPKCSDTLDEAWNDPIVNIMTRRVLNENSWGYLNTNSYQKGDKKGKPTGSRITWDSLYHENVGIASVMVNLTKTQYSGFGTLLKAAQQNGDFGNANKIASRRVLNGSTESSECEDIRLALKAVMFVLDQGSQLSLYYNNWRGVVQGNTVVSAQNACQFQINNTLFINFSNQPCTAP